MADSHKVNTNKELSIWEALIPIIVLVAMLGLNVTYAYGDDALSGSNQFILLLGAAVAAIVGFMNQVSYKKMLDTVGANIKSTTGAIIILLFVGALAGTWLISGIIPTMIYYGLQILHPSIFLPATVVICAIISVATGSSWTTSATVGIALSYQEPTSAIRCLPYLILLILLRLWLERSYSVISDTWHIQQCRRSSSLSSSLSSSVLHERLQAQAIARLSSQP